jgi:hypothetical protein
MQCVVMRVSRRVSESFFCVGVFNAACESLAGGGFEDACIGMQRASRADTTDVYRGRIAGSPQGRQLADRARIAIRYEQEIGGPIQLRFMSKNEDATVCT